MLTDAKVRSAKPCPKPYKLVDANRLFLLVTPSGGKLWRWNYYYDDKQKSMAFDKQISANEQLLAKGYVSKLKVIEMRCQRLAAARDRDAALETANRAEAQIRSAGSGLALSMAKTADILTGKRILLSYLLSPIDEARLSAGRER